MDGHATLSGDAPLALALVERTEKERMFPMMTTIEYHPIGVIHTPFTQAEGTPIQPVAPGADVEAMVEVFPEYAEGLTGLEGFSHITLLFHLHRSGKPSLTVKPFLDDQLRGVFATRAPSRPNGLGLSVVRLTRVEGRFLHVREIDILDGAPLLDIKPYAPVFDIRPEASSGWLAGKDPAGTADDGRFSSRHP